jgi:superfamily II RNA helicase
MVVICDKPYPLESNYKSHFELFDFPLSDFQKYAIEAVVTGNHVLVACPTGSGKTLPAEFAIQYFKSLGKKVIYTSPIKALSNQKYYEFTQKYPEISIGLMTGDIKVNPNADVLIMTTENLMNYLYNTLGGVGGVPAATVLQFQIDLEKELGCVVFDEVHYINDENRGGTWEQTILMLPKHVQMVMLSATIDSPEKFAKWCERGDAEKKVYLAHSNHRIVPLTHYGFLTTNESIFKGLKDKVLEKEIRDTTNRLIPLQTARGEFSEPNVKTIGKMVELFKKRNVFLKRKSVLNNLTLFLKNQDMLPAIAFVFSRKNVELCAKEVDTILLEDDSKIPYIVRRECEQMVRRLPNYKEYLELPEYTMLVALLEKGIGIHHSGMIPILREIVELFISKRYIKLLFATESFSIGLDCPIKTAVFTGLRKFDGNQDRYVFSHEYTQMAGRAGRRGIDTVGHVVHCNNLFKIPTVNEYRAILSGKPQELVSKFHLSYQVILNLMKQGVTQIDGFIEFVEKSMIHQEIQIETEKREKEMVAVRDKLWKKQEIVNQLKTPKEPMEQCREKEEQMEEMNGNQKKRAERELVAIQELYPSFEKDYRLFCEWVELKKYYANVKNDYKYMEDYIHIQIDCLMIVLEEKGFIQDVNGVYTEENMAKSDEERNTTTCWKLTELGVIASNVQEINGPITALLLTQTGFLQDFSVLQIIGILSCFTDIRVPEDQMVSRPMCSDDFLKEKIEQVSKMFEDFYQLELKYHLKTGLHSERPLNFDVIDHMMEWCGFETEQECKFFIQTKLAEKEISVGEFTKAILKISVIVKELESVCELMGRMDLLHKLSQIDAKILKYITVCQSLYV